MNGNILGFFLILLIPLVVFGSVWLFVFITSLGNNLKLRRQREKEHKENVSGSALGESGILRHIDPLELEVLKSKHQSISRWTKINHFTIPINLVVMAVVIFFGVTKDYFSSSNYWELLRWPFIIFIIQITYIFSERKVYGDLRSPVFSVTGELVKIEKKRKRDYRKIFVVRGVQFDHKENSDIEYFWDKWKDGDKVYIEYSPFTKHIWKIEKV